MIVLLLCSDNGSLMTLYHMKLRLDLGVKQ